MGIGRVVAATAIGTVGLGVLGACGWGMNERYTDSADIGERFTSVRFANDAGNVTIRAGESPSVQREVHYDNDKPGEDTFRVDDGVLELDPCPVRQCRIDYEVVVPAGTTVSGELDAGAIDISGVEEVNVRASAGEVTVRDVAGAVNVEASSGKVTLADIGGEVVAKVESGELTADKVRGGAILKASSGNVEAHGIQGPAQVESSSGNVVVELTTADDVRVEADSGNVDVTVPQGAYQVRTSADSGDVDGDLTDDPAGAHRLDLRADSGNITVTRT